MATISKNWTDVDRHSICAILARKIMDNPADAQRVYDLADMIRLVSGMNAAFLEANRAMIEKEIKGL